MYLLTHDETGTLVFRTFDSIDLPAYAILSHTWHVDDSQEVDLDDVFTGRPSELVKVQSKLSSTVMDGC
jgi:hypothetical protein